MCISLDDPNEHRYTDEDRLAAQRGQLTNPLPAPTCTCDVRHDGDDAGLVPPDPPCPVHAESDVLQQVRDIVIDALSQAGADMAQVGLDQIAIEARDRLLCILAPGPGADDAEHDRQQPWHPTSRGWVG